MIANERGHESIRDDTLQKAGHDVRIRLGGELNHHGTPKRRRVSFETRYNNEPPIAIIEG